MNVFFSISSKDAHPYKKKIIRICGLKFSYKYRSEKAPSLPNDELSNAIITNNYNLFFYVIDYMQRHDGNDLYCLKNKSICYIFNKKVLDWGVENFKDFFFNSTWPLQWVLKFSILQPTSELYQDHIKRAEKGEFLWKYMDKKIITHKFLSFGIDNKVYVNEAIIDQACIPDDTSVPHFVAKNSRRLFIEGLNLSKYIYKQSRTDEEKKAIFIRLIEFIFTKYSLPSGKIDNTLYDCHLSNFIIDNEENFHFIDDEYVSPEPLDKKYIVDYILKDFDNHEMCNEIRKHFGLSPTGKSVEKKCNRLDQLAKKYFW